MVGVDLPVRPRKRHVYHVDAPISLGAAPLTIDPTGVYLRPEGEAYIAGFSPRDGEPDPDTLDLATDRAPFEALVWPALAHRVPAFDRLRLLDTWAGHYEVNTLDHNAIIGPHPTFANLLFANGFSGHGLQQAPAVGRGLAEWIVTGQLRDDRPAAARLRAHRARRADPGAQRRLRRRDSCASDVRRMRVGEGDDAFGGPLDQLAWCRRSTVPSSSISTGKRSMPRAAGPFSSFSPRMLYVLSWHRTRSASPTLTGLRDHAAEMRALPPQGDHLGRRRDGQSTTSPAPSSSRRGR